MYEQVWRITVSTIFCVSNFTSSRDIFRAFSSSSDSNLNDSAKLQLRLIIGGAWGAMMGRPSAHYALDLQNANDRLTASKVRVKAATSHLYSNRCIQSRALFLCAAFQKRDFY